MDYIGMLIANAITNMGVAMRKAILMMILAVVSNSATAAEWVKVAETKDDNIYADPATIRREGNMVKMLTMSDFKSADYVAGKRYMSMALQYEFDCKEKLSRILALSTYTESMAMGEATYNSQITTWTPFSPKSPGETIWKFACEKRIENSYMSMANDAAQQGNCPKAFSLLAKARKKAPENYMVYFLTGMTYLRCGDLNQAEPYLKKGIDLAKHMVIQDQYTKGDTAIAYASLGDFDKAKSFAEEAKKLFAEAGDADGVNKMNAFLLQIQKH
jgi:predicted Zn-dependent protease